MIKFISKFFKNTPKSNFVLVSMYGGDEYYYRSADLLKSQCKTLGIDCDLMEVKVDDSDDWIDICKKKIEIYHSLLKKHKKMIFWVDVDTILVKSPVVPSDGFDVGIFMRGFNDLNTFDFTKYSRRFEPGYILFNYNKKVLEFLEFAVGRVKAGKAIKATDDYFLEEAFRTFTGGLRILNFSGAEIQRNKARLNNDTIFLHGDSGNVGTHKGVAKQHEKIDISPLVKKQVFLEKAVFYVMRGKVELARDLYKLAFDCDNQDVAIAEKLFKLYNKTGLPNLAKAIQKKMLEDQKTAPIFIKFLLITAFESENFDEADRLQKIAVKCKDKILDDFISSKAYRYGFDRRARLKGISEDKRTEMFWWEQPHPGNLGDVLSPYIVEKLTDIPPKFVGRKEGMLAIGSIIKWASNKSSIWGAGTSSEGIDLPKNAKYHAVRGPYTRQEVLNNGGDCPEIYGDPAWILPKLYNPAIKKTNKVGMILHFIHEDSNICISEKVKSISIRRVGFDQIEQFMDEMLSCERIISSSLHGVILANAYNIPVVWATVTDSAGAIHGDGIKFKDYFNTIGINEDLKPVNLTELSDLSEESLNSLDFWLPEKDINVEQLIKAAPFYNNILTEHKGK